MATYTLKSAAATANNTTVDLFTATGQTVVKSLFCHMGSGSGSVKMQKNGGSELTLVSFSYDLSTNAGKFKLIASDGAMVDSCLFLENGDKLRVTSGGSYTVTCVASYTVIT